MKPQHPALYPASAAPFVAAIVPQAGQTLRNGPGETWVVVDVRYSELTGKIYTVELIAEALFHADELQHAFTLDFPGFHAFCRKNSIFIKGLPLSARQWVT